MAQPRGNRRRLGSAFAFVAAVVTLGLAPGNAAPAGAAAPQGYAASDVIGQTDGGGNPVFTTSGTNDNASTPSASGVDYPQGSALDVAGHRLFADDCGNNRVLVYNLDAQENLLSRTADQVIGQPNFSSRVVATTQSGFKCGSGPSYDAVHKRLFIPDLDNRVLEFDLSAGITNGMNASHVLGQASFTSNGCAAPPTAASICDPYGGSQYDPTHDRLFVSDQTNSRLLVYDLAGGITDGMNATAVLGQPNFTTQACAITRSGLTKPYGLAYDVARQLLYVADTGHCGTLPDDPARVIVWDLAGGVSNGMDAAHILGKTSYTTGGFNADNRAAIDQPNDLALDTARQHLYVQDDNRNRVLLFDVATITDGERASAVIGQPDFVTSTSIASCATVRNATRYTQCDAEGQSQGFDVANNRLYLSDSEFDRVLIFTLVEIDSNLTPNGTVGVEYRAGIQSRGSQGTVSYAVTGGSLPPGVSLDASTGLISGTPTTAGPYSFVVTVTDDNGVIGTFNDSKPEFILVSAIPVPPTGGA